MIGQKLKAMFGGKGADPFSQVETLRTEILLAKSELRDLANAPIPRADAEAALDDSIARLARKGQADLTANLAQLVRPKGHPDFSPTMPTDSVFALLVAVAPDAVKAAVTSELNVVYGNAKRLDHLPTREAREARAKELTAQLAKDELREETLIRQIEAAGLAIARRADASPAAVLAKIDIE